MQSIDRDNLPTALFVLATVVAIGFLAATIGSIAGVDSGQRPINIEPRGGGTDFAGNGTFDNGTGGAVSSGGSSIDLTICVPFLRTLPAILAILGAVGVLLLLAYLRYEAAGALLIATGIIPVVWTSYFLTTNCTVGGTGDGNPLFDPSSIISNQNGLDAISLPPAVVAGFFAIVVVAGVFALYRTTREESYDEPEEEEPEEPDVDEFARAAGRAADRIEAGNASVDNAVYRAWLEMTSMLDVDDSTKLSPRRFAALAVQTGMDNDSVAELTELFNEVRYGGKNPTDREDRALQVLRKIERSYSGSTGGNGGVQ